MDNNTLVMKFDPTSLQVKEVIHTIHYSMNNDLLFFLSQPEYMWNISLSHYQVADMFVVCGVLYAVDHVDLRDTRIR